MATGNPGRLRSKYAFEVGEVISNLEIIEQTKLTKQERKRVSTYKAYKYKCLKCGFTDTKVESVLKMKNGCPCCKRKVVVEHINSIVADEETHWMVDYFPGGWNEAKLYLKGSEKKVKLKCPECGKVKEKPMRIADLYKRHSIGCSCRGGISYPERVGRIVFPLIDKSCVYQYKPHWSEGRFFDFYLPSYNMIIELHGVQHYKPRGFMDDTSNNDTYKELLAKNNGVQHYYQIDCRESTCEWIRTNIETIKEIDWKDVDWVEICSLAERSIVKQVCEFKENNPLASTKEICTHFSISSKAVHTYLTKGVQLGWCSITHRETPRKIEKTTGRAVIVEKSGMKVGEYRSISQCALMSEIDFGIKFSTKGIGQVCHKKREEYKGYNFKFKQLP